MASPPHSYGLARSSHAHQEDRLYILGASCPVPLPSPVQLSPAQPHRILGGGTGPAAGNQDDIPGNSQHQVKSMAPERGGPRKERSGFSFLPPELLLIPPHTPAHTRSLPTLLTPCVEHGLSGWRGTRKSRVLLAPTSRCSSGEEDADARGEAQGEAHVITEASSTTSRPSSPERSKAWGILGHECRSHSLTAARVT